MSDSETQSETISETDTETEYETISKNDTEIETTFETDTETKSESETLPSCTDAIFEFSIPHRTKSIKHYYSIKDRMHMHDFHIALTECNKYSST